MHQFANFSFVNFNQINGIKNESEWKNGMEKIALRFFRPHNNWRAFVKAHKEKRIFSLRTNECNYNFQWLINFRSPRNQRKWSIVFTFFCVFPSDKCTQLNYEHIFCCSISRRNNFSAIKHFPRLSTIATEKKKTPKTSNTVNDNWNVIGNFFIWCFFDVENAM